MRIKAFFSILIASLVTACSSDGTTTQPTNTMSVNITGFAFTPVAISIARGTTVTWTNKDAVQHDVHSDTGTELSSQALNQNGTYSHAFSTAGTFNYHCVIHPNMTGSVNVL